ncbi:MAG TPA: hypothetical protein VMN36_09370 [Verrucomicrobiales bacterium]|nr:hypothetical protein [Verrucomicrobiales bacterium]
MRRNREEGGGDTLQSELSHQLVSLLQGLQAVQGVAPAPQREPAAPPSKRIPPPLGQAAGVVPSRAARRQERMGGTIAEDEGLREKRLIPFKDQESAPLPELVAMEAMETDSDVAQQWGEGAVIRPGRLRWLGRLLVLGLVLGAVYFVLDFLMFRERTESEPSAQTPVVGEDPEAYACRQVLARYLLTDSNPLKAPYLREGIHLLPVMADFAKRAPSLPTVIDTFSVTRKELLGGRRFLFAEGTFRDGTSISPTFEHRGSEFLLDWKSLVGYSEASFRKFAEEKTLVQAKSPLFRLVVRAGGRDEIALPGIADRFRSFPLYSTAEGFEYEVMATKNSQESRGLNDAAHGGDGKVMVRLRVVDAGEAGRVVVVEEFVGPGWLQP